MASAAERARTEALVDGAGDHRLVRRHGVRMVRLLHLRQPRAGHLEGVLRRARPDAGADRRARAVRRGLRLPPARRADLRRRRRPARPQGRVPDHRQPDGRRDLPDRLPADLRAGRHARPGPADPAPHPAGDRARRRIWRRGDLRRRACARRQARRLDRLDPVVGLVRPARRLAGDRRHPHRDRRGRVRRLGLARAVPGLGGPARHLGVDARQARRKPALRQAARGGRGDHARRCAKRSANGATSSAC